jgi:TolB-like protein
MRTLLIALTILISSAITQAQTASTPTAPAAQPAGATVKVYVVFSESAALLRPGWLSSRLATVVRDDLEPLPSVQIVKAPAEATDADPKAQLTRARQAGAEVAVIGAASVEGDKLSVTGDVYDVSTGNSFGNFKANGTTRDLFKVQDSIVHQIRQIVDRIASPSAGTAVASKTPAAGTNFEGSNLQASINDYTFRGANNNRYDQPYHVVEPPDISFSLPYDYGGYGYSGYGWPSYTYYNPYYSPYYGGGYYGNGWNNWGWGPSVIIINQDFIRDHMRNRGNSGGNQGPIPAPAPTVPTEIRTRGQMGSVVATPPANTIQQSPSYEIRPVTR